MASQERAAPDLAGNKPTPSTKKSLGFRSLARLNNVVPGKDAHSSAPESQKERTEASGDDKSEPQDSTNPSDASEPKFRVVEHEGDIFDAPDHSVLIHACNCFGLWGAGIAAAFRDRYPEAHDIYYKHCESFSADELVGTALLIPPSESEGRKHYVGCLFTSRMFGVGRDSPRQILANTGPAMEDLIEQIAKAVRDGSTVSEIRTCHINSGLFSVPWKRSKAVMEDLKVPEDFSIGEITAWNPAPRP